jgi:hypothetical protein
LEPEEWKFMVKKKGKLVSVLSYDIWGSGGTAPPFLTLALDGVE